MAPGCPDRARGATAAVAGFCATVHGTSVRLVTDLSSEGWRLESPGHSFEL